MELLEYFNLFHKLPPPDYDLLIAKLQPKNFRKNDSLMVPGQIQKQLYFVKSGVQMAFFDGENKSHVIAFTYKPNLCAIPESFFFQSPSKYHLTCLTESELDQISFEDLQVLFDQSRELERLFRKMTEAVLAGVIKRHIELHSLGMEERFITFCQRSPHLLQLVPHRYLASYLGMDSTNFSKLFNRVRI